MRLSIITPSYQQARYLPECLRSVQQQEGVEVEHIVVDGGSTDGSAAIIERHAAHLAWWCSERDQGQADALNKGLAHATGDVFGWINSDDLLLPGALARVARAFAEDPDLLVLEGERIVREEDGGERIAPLDDPHDPDRWCIAPMVNQQSTFMRLSAVRAVGGVDPHLRYAMDHELWLRLLFRFGTDHVRIERGPLAVFRLHAGAKTGGGAQTFVHEIAGVLHGLCINAGLLTLAHVLEAGYTWPRGIRRIDVPPGKETLVRRMAEHFLLRWNHVIFEERQFRMMRLLLRTAPPDPARLDDEGRARLRAVQEQLAVPGWWAFRLKRKLKHLRR